MVSGWGHLSDGADAIGENLFRHSAKSRILSEDSFHVSLRATKGRKFQTNPSLHVSRFPTNKQLNHIPLSH